VDQAVSRAIVTGGAGFIGSHLCEALLARGDDVLCLDNLSTGSEQNIAHLLPHPHFRFIRHDICQPLDIPEPAHWVLHLASPASPVDYARLPIQTLKVGSLGTHNALGIALRHGSRFLLASTSEVYGDPEVHPQTEDYWGHVNPIGPRSCYDESKRFAEAMTVAYARAHGVNTCIVRIFNTYGPRMRLHDGRVVPAFIGQALAGEPFTVFGDGSQTRSFCYVSDMVRGLLAALDSAENGPINLGNPAEMTIVDFARKIASVAGVECRLKYKSLPEDDPKQRRPDITRAKKLLGWEPQVSLDEGLAQTYRWFAEHSTHK
jgi:dTDP-glucose 4,6-dehydratase